MATEKWIAGSGVGLSWTTACGTEITTTAITNGNAILSSVQIDNSSPLDIFCDVSYLAGGTITSLAPNYLGLYLYPLGQDGSTYGDGRFGSAAAGPPPGNYWVGNISFAAAASTTVAGVWTGIILPPGAFKFVLYNQAGASLPASGNVMKYRTYNRSIA
jgi:hypothetical protein